MNKHITTAIVASLLLLAAPVQAATDLSKQPTVYQSGKWEVRKSVDAMTDKITCTGIYNKGYRYQLNEDSFFIGVKGGPRSATLRYGDNPPEPLRLASDLETRINYIILKDGEFRKLLSVNRLRMESLTYILGIVSADIDLTGMSNALNFIKSGCQAPTANNNQPATPAPTQPKRTGNEHAHGDRSHSHPLPAEGVKHRHGNGEIGR